MKQLLILMTDLFFLLIKTMINSLHHFCNFAYMVTSAYAHDKILTFNTVIFYKTLPGYSSFCRSQIKLNCPSFFKKNLFIINCTKSHFIPVLQVHYSVTSKHQWYFRCNVVLLWCCVHLLCVIQTVKMSRSSDQIWWAVTFPEIPETEIRVFIMRKWQMLHWQILLDFFHGRQCGAVGMV